MREKSSVLRNKRNASKERLSTFRISDWNRLETKERGKLHLFHFFISAPYLPQRAVSRSVRFVIELKERSKSGVPAREQLALPL